MLAPMEIETALGSMQILALINPVFV